MAVVEGSDQLGASVRPRERASGTALASCWVPLRCLTSALVDLCLDLLGWVVGGVGGVRGSN